MITLQQIFDAAVDAFIKKRQPLACSPIDGPCYRLPDGRRCAIGLCLPETVTETCDFYGLIEKHPELFDETIRALTHHDTVEIQGGLHDYWIRRATDKYLIPDDVMPEFIDRYIGIAKAYGLKCNLQHYRRGAYGLTCQ